MIHEDLLRILHYSPTTGEFTWLVDSGARKVQGKKAGTVGVDHPCIYISYKRKKYLAHRLAWLYVYGVWPPGQVDHKDGDPGNNKLANLRLATNAQNQQNLRAPKGANPYVGVYEVRKGGSVRYVARVNNKHIGTRPTAEAARKLYLETKRRVHTHLPE